MAAQPSGVSTTPPSLVSSANLLRVHSNSSSRSLIFPCAGARERCGEEAAAEWSHSGLATTPTPHPTAPGQAGVAVVEELAMKE